MLVAASLTTGCISFFDTEEEQQQETKVKNRETGLVVPEGFNNPLKSEHYKLYKGDEKQYTEILAPTTVLVMLEGTWVNEEDKHPAKIMLEKPSSVDNLSEFIDQSLQSYFKVNDLSATKTDKGYRVTKTYSEDIGYWFWEIFTDVEQLEYDVSVDIKPHGRSGEMYVDVVGYQVIDDDLAPDVSPAQRSSALSIQALNDIMLEVDYQHRVKVTKQQESIDISVKLVKNLAGNYVISSQQDIKYVWSQVEDIIEDLGFDIQDEDETLYVYDTVFAQAGTSIWNILGSDISNKLNIKEGEYEVALSTSTTGVDISFRAKNGGFLSQSEMENLFELFIQVAEDEGAEI